MRRFTANESAAGMRADVFITDKLSGYSRSSLSRLFEEGSVKVNKKTARAGYKLRPGDKLSVDDRLLKMVPPAAALPVIYEDESVVVVNKPAGLLTHSKGALNEESTVAGSLRSKISPELTGNRAGVVHRLDRGTSGVIILAKTETALKNLQKQFSTRKVEKTYLAIVEGEPKPGEAVIDAPIARNPQKPQTFMVKAGGKPAQTKYKVLKSFSTDGRQVSLLELKPVTGRTHQLRVHLKYLDHPIVGDHVYGRGDGLMLHASSLSLLLPSGERRAFQAEPPKPFKEFYGSE